MATTIKLKNGSGAPLAGNLVQGEPALDLTNKRLYTEDSGGTVIEVGTNPGTDVTFADNRKAIFGAGSDLQIYHTGSGSFISDQGPGPLNILTSGFNVINPGNTETLIDAVENGAVQLYYDNSAKLATTATGIDVTGTVTADGLTVEGRGSINQSMTNGSVSAFTNPHLALKSTDSVDTTGFVGISFATSDTTNYGFSLGSQRTSGGQGDLVVRNHFNSAQGTKKLSIADNGDISFYEDTGTTAKLFWDASAESLGIGTGSPNALLSLSSGSGTKATIETTRNFTVNRNFQIAVDEHAEGTLTITPSTTLGGSTYTTPIITATAAGNVGIGNSNPQNKLDIEQSAAVSARLLATGATSSSVKLEVKGGATQLTTTEILANSSGALTFATGTTSSAEAMRIDSSGNFLVGTTSFTAGGGGHKLEPAGARASSRDATSSQYHNLFYNPNGLVGGITTSGSTTAYNTSSDQRLKENIVDAPSASDDIDAIQVRSFDWKVDGSHQKYGMVAQELQSVVPEAVSEGATEEEMMGVDYSKLVPMLVKEIQSLRARVAQLEGAN